jgi:DNA-binding GntR family transcriptional regulator
MQHSEAVANQIKARIRELRTEIEAHERALAALEGGHSHPARTAPASNGRRPRARTARATRPSTSPRSRGAASTEQVFEALKGGVDQAAVIAKQFGVSTAVVRNRLQQLEEAGRVSRTGTRRSTRWRSHAG